MRFLFGLQINQLSYQSSNENGMELAKNGDVLTLHFQQTMNQILKTTMSNGGKVLKLNQRKPDLKTIQQRSD